MSEYFQQIEAYLSDELSSEERLKFEDECKQNSQLAQDFAFYLQAHQASIDQIREIKKQAFIDRYSSQEKSKPLFKNRTFIAAAIVLFFTASLWITLQQRNSVDISELISTYIEYPQLPKASIARNLEDEGLDKQWENAVAAYNRSDFETSTSLFEKMNAKVPAEHLSEFYLLLGTSYLRTEKNRLAIEAYQKVSAESIYSQEASWFYSLALLNSGQMNNARKSLRSIAEERDHYRHKEAAKLLKKL